MRLKFETFDAAQGVADILDGTSNFTGFKLQATLLCLATGAELNYVDGVTSNIQTQHLDGRQHSCNNTSVPLRTKLHIDNLVTLTGVAKDETDLDTFTGVYELNLLDGVTATIKAARWCTATTGNRSRKQLQTTWPTLKLIVDQNESDATTCCVSL